MNALTVAEELPIPALFVQGVEESREPSQRDEHAAAVGEFGGQVVVVARYIMARGRRLDRMDSCRAFEISSRYSTTRFSMR